MPCLITIATIATIVTVTVALISPEEDRVLLDHLSVDVLGHTLKVPLRLEQRVDAV